MTTETRTSDSFGWQVFGVVMGLIALFAVVFMVVTTYQFRHQSNSSLNEKIRALAAHSRVQDNTLSSFVDLTGSMIRVQENQETLLHMFVRSSLSSSKHHRIRIVQQK